MSAAKDLGVQFSEFDEHIKNAPHEVGHSFFRLQRYILEQCPLGTYRTLFLFRGIFIWLLKMHKYCVNVPREHTHSPMNLISEYRVGNMSTNLMIDIICSFCDIPSRTINGFTRVIGVNVDMKDKDITSKFQVSWNAIDINGSWFLLKTDMFFPAEIVMVGDEWKLEQTFQEKNEVERFLLPLSDIIKPPDTAFDEFWFLVNPDTFINFCYPDEPAEQFLPKNKQVSRQDFLDRPLLHPAYFRYRFHLLSEKTCKLNAVQGQCYISLYAAETVASNLEMSCELIRVMDRDSYSLAKEVTSIMVTQFRTLETFTFEFRFVEEGKYRAIISCKEVDSDAMERCCEFEISCNDESTSEDEPRFMSMNTSNTFGIGPAAINAGIISSSGVYPKTYIVLSETDDEIREYLKFRLSEETLDTCEYQLTLEACDIRGILQVYNDCVSCKVDKVTSVLTVTIYIPKHRANIAKEYVLTINASNAVGDDKSFVPVYYHLFTKKQNDTDVTELRQLEKQRKRMKYVRYMQLMSEEEQNLMQEIQSLRGEIGQLKQDFPKVAEEMNLDEESLNGKEADNEFEDTDEKNTELQDKMTAKDVGKSFNDQTAFYNLEEAEEENTDLKGKKGADKNSAGAKQENDDKITLLPDQMSDEIDTKKKIGTYDGNGTDMKDVERNRNQRLSSAGARPKDIGERKSSGKTQPKHSGKGIHDKDEIINRPQRPSAAAKLKYTGGTKAKGNRKLERKTVTSVPKPSHRNKSQMCSVM